MTLSLSSRAREVTESPNGVEGSWLPQNAMVARDKDPSTRRPSLRSRLRLGMTDGWRGKVAPAAETRERPHRVLSESKGSSIGRVLPHCAVRIAGPASARGSAAERPTLRRRGIPHCVRDDKKVVMIRNPDACSRVTMMPLHGMSRAQNPRRRSHALAHDCDHPDSVGTVFPSLHPERSEGSPCEAHPRHGRPVLPCGQRLRRGIPRGEAIGRKARATPFLRSG